MSAEPRFLLSICIPTYNFGKFIGETLSSIVPQAGQEVEIVVLDGGSTDDTESVVRAFEQGFDRLNYVRMPEKGGIDKDMALAVSHARGEYIWLFGADDIMDSGALRLVLEKIRSGADVYLAETTLASFSMRPIRRHRNLELDEERTFELSDPLQRREYLRLGVNTQAIFSFCGALIIRKQRWDDVQPDPDFMGSCWAHVTRILRMLPHGLRVHHIPGSLSYKRMGNDSFMDRGIVNRVRIAVDGYLGIAQRFFPDAEDRRDIVRCLKAEFSPWSMALLKMGRIAEGDHQGVSELEDMFRRLYEGPRFRDRLAIAAYLHTPSLAWRVMSFARLLAKKFVDRDREDSASAR